eukprot:Awhi_evm1s470
MKLIAFLFCLATAFTQLCSIDAALHFDYSSLTLAEKLHRSKSVVWKRYPTSAWDPVMRKLNSFGCPTGFYSPRETIHNFVRYPMECERNWLNDRSLQATYRAADYIEECITHLMITKACTA